MIMVQKRFKVKERAHPYLQRRFVNMTRPDKWSHNICFKIEFQMLDEEESLEFSWERKKESEEEESPKKKLM